MSDLSKPTNSPVDDKLSFFKIPHDIILWNTQDGTAHKAHGYSFFVGLATFIITNSINFKYNKKTTNDAQTQTINDIEMKIIIV